MRQPPRVSHQADSPSRQADSPAGIQRAHFQPSAASPWVTVSPAAWIRYASADAIRIGAAGPDVQSAPVSMRGARRYGTRDPDRGPGSGLVYLAEQLGPLGPGRRARHAQPDHAREAP